MKFLDLELSNYYLGEGYGFQIARGHAKNKPECARVLLFKGRAWIVRKYIAFLAIRLWRILVCLGLWAFLWALAGEEGEELSRREGFRTYGLRK